MRVSKFLLIIFLATFLSLLYVWHQTQIFSLAYAGQRNLVTFQDLLEKNTLLRYNIERNTSLVRLANKISTSADFQMPDTYRLVKLVSPKGSLGSTKQSPSKLKIVARLFGVKRQAEAKTVNPSKK